MLDLIIRGGAILDGTGAPSALQDVGVQAGRIREIGNLKEAESIRLINAVGCYVCPGFIDVHSHSDAYLLVEPSAPSKIGQGITTEVVGNCGASAAPRIGACKLPADWLDKSYPGTWQTVAEYRTLLEQVKPAVNVVLLIGHRNLRTAVMGYAGRPAWPDEVGKMAALLAQALEEGGGGFSTGLVYAPGMFAQPEELMALARIAAEHGGLYTSHMRSEGARLIEAIDETLDVGRQSGARIEISHLKTSGQKNWPLADAALDRIHKARAEGVDVSADRYPYTASCTELDVILPAWAAEGGRETVLARLRTLKTRWRIRNELLATRDAAYWEGVVIGSTWRPDNRVFQGRPLLEAAEQLKLDPVDVALHFFETDQLRTGAIFFGMSEENMWKILREPWVMLGTDASLRAPEGVLGQDHPHPRAYGSFPRYLRASLDGKTVELPEAVRKMTSLPAGHFRLKNRGIVAPGAWADLVVFDPARVRDVATYEKPHRLAEGIEWVIVNGAVTAEHGRLTGVRKGQFLG